MSPALIIAIGAVLSCATVLLLVPPLRAWALKRDLVDQPDERKRHAVAVPAVGGIAIWAGFAVAMLWFAIASAVWGVSFAVPGWPMWVGLGVIVLVGAIDDIRGVHFREKFAIQFLVAYGLFAAGYRIELGTWLPAGVDAYTEAALSLPLTLLWIVGVTNAVNIIDGLDGLAGGVAVLGLSALTLAGVMTGNWILVPVAVPVIAALFGFLRYNITPASIFMGDSGSLPLGYLLAVSSLTGVSHLDPAIALAVPIFALGFPLWDTATAMFRRFVRRLSPFEPDHDHIHHRLLERLGPGHRRPVVVVYALSALFATTAVLLAVVPAVGVPAAILCVCVMFGMMRWLGYVHVRDTLHQFLQNYVPPTSSPPALALADAGSYTAIAGTYDSGRATTNSLRVLIVTPQYPAVLASTTQRVLNYAPSWVKAERDVEVLTAMPPEAKETSRAAMDVELVQGVRTARVSLSPLKPNRRRGLRSAPSLLNLVTHSMRHAHPADVVVGGSFQATWGVAACLIAQLRKIPFIYEAREIWSEVVASERNRSEQRVLHAALRAAERYCMRHASAIVVHTQAFKDRLLRLGAQPARVQVIDAAAWSEDVFADALDLERLAALQKQYELEDAFVVAQVCLQQEMPDVQTTLAVAELCQQEDIVFLLLCDAAMYKRLKDSVNQMGLENIRVVKVSATDDLVSLTHLSRLLLSLSDAPTIRPLGLELAWALGRPTISVRDSLAGGLVEDSGTGIALWSATPVDFADAIKHLRTDSSAYASFADKAVEQGVRAEGDPSSEYWTLLEATTGKQSVVPISEPEYVSN